MGETLEDFVQELKEQIFEETKEAYGEIAFQRWQNPLYRGPMKDPDGFACVRGACGDAMEIYLKFENDRVKEASFQTDGCGSSTVCGSFTAEMTIGKNPDELSEITEEAIKKKMGRIPKEDEHLATLASQTLREALKDYMEKQNRKET